MKTSLTVAAMCAAVLISTNARADVVLDWNEIMVVLASLERAGFCLRRDRGGYLPILMA